MITGGWRGDYEHWLLFQVSKVQFLALTWWLTTPWSSRCRISESWASSSIALGVVQRCTHAGKTPIHTKRPPKKLKIIIIIDLIPDIK